MHSKVARPPIPRVVRVDGRLRQTVQVGCLRPIQPSHQHVAIGRIHRIHSALSLKELDALLQACPLPLEAQAASSATVMAADDH
eukprot:1907293-Prymnesium_polylepis.1